MNQSVIVAQLIHDFRPHTVNFEVGKRPVVRRKVVAFVLVRGSIPCAPLNTLSGDLISWVDELRYLGVFRSIFRSHMFK